jgi:hypothetical protein
MVRFIDCSFKHALLTKLQLQEQEAPEFLMVRGGLGKLKIVIGPGTFFLLLQPVQMLGFLLNSGCVRFLCVFVPEILMLSVLARRLHQN